MRDDVDEVDATEPSEKKTTEAEKAALREAVMQELAAMVDQGGRIKNWPDSPPAEAHDTSQPAPTAASHAATMAGGHIAAPLQIVSESGRPLAPPVPPQQGPIATPASSQQLLPQSSVASPVPPNLLRSDTQVPAAPPIAPGDAQPAGQQPPALHAQLAGASDIAQLAAYSGPLAQVPGEIDQPPEEQFQDTLDEAIEAIKRELKDEKLKDEDRVRREVILRFLYLASDNPQTRERAINPIDPLDKSEREYWAKQLFSLKSLLEYEMNPNKDRRASAALVNLRNAVGSLADISTLQVRDLRLCTEVRGYGVYNEFSEMRFKAGQRAILYAEIDNFSSERKATGFETHLEGQFDIYDRVGIRVASHKFANETDFCRRRRRDFFLPYHMYFPDDIAPGNYRLELTVTDIKANKIGQESIDFTIEK